MSKYNSTIPIELGQKLKEYGMPMDYGTDFPTYGDVFDWFEEKSIIITLEPFITYTFKNHIGYTWKISRPNLWEGYLERITENDVVKNGEGYGGSFELTANAAIEYAMTIELENL